MKIILPLWLCRILIVEWSYGSGYYFRRNLPDKGLKIFNWLFKIYEDTLRVKYPNGWD